MSYIPGMGWVKDFPAEPPEDPPEPELMYCDACNDEMPVVVHERDREIDCATCGTCLYAYDWEAEAERRAGW